VSAEVGRGCILAGLDDAAPDAARLHEQARCKAVRSSLKRPSISSTASLLLRKTSRHMTGSEAAMRVKSRKPPAENLITSVSVTRSRCRAVLTML
jgi:hypothetical protein